MPVQEQAQREKQMVEDWSPVAIPDEGSGDAFEGVNGGKADSAWGEGVVEAWEVEVWAVEDSREDGCG
jgi:hypothetical protein